MLDSLLALTALSWGCLQTVRPLDNTVEAKHTAALVNELSAEMCRILQVGAQAKT